MNEQRWLRVESIVLEAAGRNSAERTVFLDEACAGDEALRREVESLLHYESDAEHFLADSAMDEAVRLAAVEVALDTAHLQIDGYEIGEFLGAGGMGEVYRARDVRLDRDVALKIIRQEPNDITTTIRIEEEARAASRLNHPNIVTMHAVGSQSDVSFIVMELVSGRTLRDLLSAGPPPLATTLEIAAQLADGLAAAHANGVIHRDLKPENVMVTSDGRVKILDFGIARRDRANATETLPATSPAGTLGYMAPEQAAQGAIDHRADQFAFGAIVHELLTGRPGSDGSLALRIPNADARLVAPLSATVERSLKTRPEDRYSSTRELAAAVRRIRDLAIMENRSLLTRRQALAATVGLGVVAAAAVWLGYGGVRIRRLAVLPFVSVSQNENEEVLGDGIAEVLIGQLWSVPGLTVIGKGTAFQLKGTSRDPRNIGRQLDVQGVLHGSVSIRGGRLVVDVELADARTGVRIWGVELNRSEADVLAIQNEIAATILADGIGLARSKSSPRELTGVGTKNRDAYRLFLQAIHRFRQDTEADYLAARDLLMQVVARDRAFALAHLTLGSTYTVMAIDGFEDPRTAWPQSHDHVSRALEQDPGLPDAHAERAAEAFFSAWDWTEALREWEQALQSRRGDVQGELLTGYVLQQWAMGRNEAALKFSQAARAIDPLSPMLAIREADVLAAMGTLSAAADRYVKVIEQVPGNARAYFGLAQVRQKQQRFDDANTALRRAVGDVGDDALSTVLATARGRDGYRSIERHLAALELEALSERSASGAYVSPLDRARAHARLQHAGEAFALLDEAFVHRSAGLAFLRVDAAWDNIRNDPRFDRAVRRVPLFHSYQRG